MHKEPMTALGSEMLRDELEHLKKHDRRNIIKAIAEARAHGDLKENAEYHAAKERQGFIEGRIMDIESKLAIANIIDITKLPQNGRVVFGSTVRMINSENDHNHHYQIVGEDEANIKKGKISFKSPIARAVIGKEEGDVVHVNTPSGILEYEILEVQYI